MNKNDKRQIKAVTKQLKRHNKGDRTGWLLVLFIAGWVFSALAVIGFWAVVIWAIVQAGQWFGANT